MCFTEGINFSKLFKAIFIYYAFNKHGLNGIFVEKNTQNNTQQTISEEDLSRL